MFGIDIGISVSSVSYVTSKLEVLDSKIIFGDKKNPDEWKRIVNMANAIILVIEEMGKSMPDKIIHSRVSIEEPVFPYRTRNPRSYFNMCCLYALIRNKLQRNKFKIYSIHPLSAKSTARKKAWGTKKVTNPIYAKRGSLTKKGMIRAYERVTGKIPEYRNAIGRETLADSFFIAVTGIDRRKVGM